LNAAKIQDKKNIIDSYTNKNVLNILQITYSFIF
jgi:hypothetical protein